MNSRKPFAQLHTSKVSRVHCLEHVIAEILLVVDVSGKLISLRLSRK